MNKEIDLIVEKALEDSNFNSVALGLIDFDDLSFSSKFYSNLDRFDEEREVYFDLASITKPMTLGLSYLAAPEIFDQEMILLLEHRSGLPAWGRLSHSSWRELLLSYKISESDTLYSDFGALRLQLEIEKKIGKSVYEFIKDFHDKEIKNWLSLNGEQCVPTGFRRGQEICGHVHDDNAFVINSPVCHAGLFGSVEGLCRNLVKLEKDFSFISKIGLKREHRFNKGFDRVENPSKSLAGVHSDETTFGHLGFTGTSFWIYPNKNKGIVILTNETATCWYDREKLSKFRKDVANNLLK